MTSPAPGDLAFVGPNHIEELSDFQYVELVEINDATATVKLAVPTEDENPSQLTLPLETFKLRAVPACERSMWPGSFVAHPIAFACTSSDGVDEWTYGVVSGYTSSEQATTLHVVCQDGSVRLPLSSTVSVIKADVLNYALQTGARVTSLRRSC